MKLERPVRIERDRGGGAISQSREQSGCVDTGARCRCQVLCARQPPGELPARETERIL